LSNGGGLKELEQFHNYLSDYKIVYVDLSPDSNFQWKIPFKQEIVPST